MFGKYQGNILLHFGIYPLPSRQFIYLAALLASIILRNKLLTQHTRFLMMKQASFPH